jgi:hypothetical protein
MANAVERQPRNNTDAVAREQRATRAAMAGNKREANVMKRERRAGSGIKQHRCFEDVIKMLCNCCELECSF